MTDEERQRRREANKRYYDKHRDKERARARGKSQKYRAANPEKARAYVRNYRKQNRDKVYFWWLKSTYGLTREQYEALYATQNGVCAICKEPGKFVVDHDHKTGRVRGLLHDNCNKGLGNFLDDAVRLQNAIAYLKNA